MNIKTEGTNAANCKTSKKAFIISPKLSVGVVPEMYLITTVAVFPINIVTLIVANINIARRVL